MELREVKAQQTPPATLCPALPLRVSSTGASRNLSSGLRARGLATQWEKVPLSSSTPGLLASL